jgi:Zn ribbon nucleic-acid-binding protein
MGFSRQCPSCTKYVQIATVEGNYATSHRCEHCGFTIQIPPKENVMKSGDYGD